MNGSLRKPIGARQWLPLALLLLLPAIGWLGVLDAFSSRYVDEALVAGGVVFATARGINAIVSVLQGTELDAVMLTFSIGELLDPVNDLIERFSGVMLVALGSLALQKILLGVVSDPLFNALLTALALAAALTLLAGERQTHRLALRAFVFAAFVRFSLGLVVLANSWVDARFLDAADQQRQQAMESFQGELREISNMAGVQPASPQALAAARARVDSLQTSLSAEQGRLEQRRGDLARARRALDELTRQRPRWQGWNPLAKAPPDVALAKAQVQRLEGEVEDIAAQVGAVDEALDEQRAALECLEKRAAGGDCGLLNRISSRLSPSEIGVQISALEERMTEFADNAIALLMSALLKSVAIPLMFFYVLLRLARSSWLSGP
jgi:prefoldin subunit 5